MSLQMGVATTQTQSLVITTRLLQSIKLLQLSNIELTEFVRHEVEKNPFLELASGGEPSTPQQHAAEPVGRETNPKLQSKSFHERPLNLDASPIPTPKTSSLAGPAPKNYAQGSMLRSPEKTNLEAYCSQARNLRDHLIEQLPMASASRADILIAREIIHSLDDDGYFRRSFDELAALLGVSEQRIADVLQVVQTLDPAGVAARDLGECLRLQLLEEGALTEPMQTMVDNLDLVAKLDLQKLGRLCGISETDVFAMMAKIRKLNPRPGRQFDASPVIPAIPDVFLSPMPDGGWRVELNTEYLPRVLVDHTYYAEISGACREKSDKRFVTSCISDANWLVKNIERRANTILKVAAEIVAHQEEFFTKGVEHLKPLTLKTIAKAIDMHESSASRVTSNKYIMTNRGLFELKFFFSNSITSSSEDGEAFSAESVRHKIRNLVDGETVDNILSDDAIVEELSKDGVDIARRTVAKYRDAMNIPSSVRRRRLMRALNAETAA